MASIYEQKPWLKNYPSWIPPFLEVPRENLVQGLKRAVVRRGSEPALYYFGRPLSYEEVDKASNSLAAALQDLGLRKGERVVFHMQNIPQFVIAQYAVWKVGGIVVPLNPMFKGKELEYYLRDSGAKMLITLDSTYEGVGKKVVGQMNIGPVITTSGLDFLPPDEPDRKSVV